MNLRQLLLFFVIQFMTFGCINKSTNDIIEVDTMAEIIFDISLAGAAVIFSRTDTTQSPHEISRMVQVWQSIIMLKMINGPTDTTVCL